MDGRFDTSYPLLFSHPRMVADLLGGFLPEEWIGWLDLRTLERRDGDGPPERDGMVIWRCRWQGGSDWVYLLLKAQTEDDPFIALHLELCRNLFYRAFLRRQQRQRLQSGRSLRLPAVVPVVLYGGAAPWTAPRDARELFLPLVPALQGHVPRTRYLLLDAAHAPLPAKAGEDNLVTLLCELERSRTPEEVDPLLERLAARLAESGDEPLRRAWSRFLGLSFLPRRFPLLFPEPGPEASPLAVPAAESDVLA
jgi:Putative transposase, YhgA-like